MRALRYHGRGDVRLDHIPEPLPGPEDVKIEVSWSGLCGSDLHEYRHGPAAIRTQEHPHPLTGSTLPVVLGHEFSGTIVEIGREVHGHTVGDRVTVEPLLRDGDCLQCQYGRYNLCQHLAFIGLKADGGGMAEESVVPASSVHTVSEDISTEAAALVEPCAVAWHAIDRVQLTEVDDVLVLGAGPVGLAILLCLKHRGIGRVIVSEPSARRREAALALGADRAVDPASSNVVREAKGVRAAFDCAGHPDAIAAGVSALGPGGVLVLVAQPPERIAVAARRLVHLEVMVTGSIAYANTFPSVLEAMRKGMDPTGMISSRLGLSDAVASMGALSRAQDELKVLVDPRR